jgi:hemin uptake protein HemP
MNPMGMQARLFSREKRSVSSHQLFRVNHASGIKFSDCASIIA